MKMCIGTLSRTPFGPLIGSVPDPRMLRLVVVLMVVCTLPALIVESMKA